jgi:hypothetical protein
MTKKRRVYRPRFVGGKIMMQADLERLHKYMIDVEDMDHISDEMRAVVESEWPELARQAARHPRRRHGGHGGGCQSMMESATNFARSIESTAAMHPVSSAVSWVLNEG